MSYSRELLSLFLSLFLRQSLMSHPGLQLSMCPKMTLNFWASWHQPQCQVYVTLWLEPRALWMLDKLSTNWATYSASLVSSEQTLSTGHSYIHWCTLSCQCKDSAIHTCLVTGKRAVLQVSSVKCILRLNGVSVWDSSFRNSEPLKVS